MPLQIAPGDTDGSLLACGVFFAATGVTISKAFKRQRLSWRAQRRTGNLIKARHTGRPHCYCVLLA